MSTVLPISCEDARIEAAGRWVLKINEGGLSESDKVALDEWLSEDPRHRDVFLEVAGVWDKTDALARLAELFPHEATPDQLQSAPWYRPWTQGIAVAASLVVLSVAVALLLSRADLFPGGDQPLTVHQNTFETVIGEHKSVLLPDGSEVVMNTNTQFSMSFTQSARVLHLARGEMFIRVGKDESRPLSVFAAGRIIQAVGTEFTVEISEDQKVEVLVTEGKVMVGVLPPSVASNYAVETNASAPTPVLEQRDDNTVSAGEEVILDASDVVRNEVTNDDIEVKLSWKEGSLVFRSESLENALKEIERYTTVEFILLDENLKVHTVSGRFRAGDVDALLASLKMNFNISHEFDRENNVLLSSP